MSKHPIGPPEEIAEMHPANRRADIDRVEEAVLGALGRFGYSESAKFAIRLALEEGLVNAFLHGHRGLPAEETAIVNYRIGPAEVMLAITDRGPGFKPEAVPDPTDQENVELPSGRGLMLIRAFMTEVRHEANGNRLVMVYKRPADELPGAQQPAKS